MIGHSGSAAAPAGSAKLAGTCLRPAQPPFSIEYCTSGRLGAAAFQPPRYRTTYAPHDTSQQALARLTLKAWPERCGLRASAAAYQWRRVLNRQRQPGQPNTRTPMKLACYCSAGSVTLLYTSARSAIYNLAPGWAGARRPDRTGSGISGLAAGLADSSASRTPTCWCSPPYAWIGQERRCAHY